MPLAGNVTRAPGYTKATATSTSANITTTETVVDTITADLISGQEYEVHFYGIWGSSVASDECLIRIREDSLTGTQMVDNRVRIGTANKYYAGLLQANYTATATAAKTFKVTLVRESGTGNCTRGASATSPALFTVRQVS
jgi:hypothetical protein